MVTINNITPPLVYTVDFGKPEKGDFPQGQNHPGGNPGQMKIKLRVTNGEDVEFGNLITLPGSGVNRPRK
jgi:hypothetical protein